MNATDTATAPAPESTVDDRELVIRDLHVVPAGQPDKEILRGIDLTVRKGEVHAIMGRNGSGKTTLAYALMGHPAYEVTGGEVIWRGINILDLPGAEGCGVILRGVHRNDATILVGGLAHTLASLHRASPWLSGKLNALSLRYLNR